MEDHWRPRSQAIVSKTWTTGRREKRSLQRAIGAKTLEQSMRSVLDRLTTGGARRTFNCDNSGEIRV